MWLFSKYSFFLLPRKLKKNVFILFCKLQQLGNCTKPIWVVYILKNSKYVQYIPLNFSWRTQKIWIWFFVCMLKKLKRCENMWGWFSIIDIKYSIFLLQKSWKNINSFSFVSSKKLIKHYFNSVQATKMQKTYKTHMGFTIFIWLKIY